MKLLKKLLKIIRSNGYNPERASLHTRQIIYTNMIWIATFLGIIIHGIIITIFIPQQNASFLIINGAAILFFSAGFMLMKKNFTAVAKHWAILSTYITVGLIDHLFGKTTYTYLHFFAFLPAAMNIFSFRKHMFVICLYTCFPLVYTLITRMYSYQYPHWVLNEPSHIRFISVLNIVLAFILITTFAGYMILNNMAKYQRLSLQSVALQATLDNSAASIWSIDKDFNLLATNVKYISSIEKEFGVSGLKRGVNIRKHLIWEKLPQHLRDEYHMVLSGQEIQHEITLNERIYEVKGIPVYNENGEVAGATFGSRDITEKKKNEAILIKAKQDAEEASTAKARFLSNMSHELRTPLNGIIGITRIMQDEKMLPEQAGNFKTLQDLSEHTLQIINNILDLAKMEAGKASLVNNVFNLKNFLSKISSIFSGTARMKGLIFDVETEGETDIFVSGDEVRLSQVLINLIGNAFKFTKEGGVILKVISSCNDDQHYLLHIEVQDSGIGIRKENIHKIFESFNQADSKTTRMFGGTGLGLSIAENILNLMGSRITVDSKYGFGSIFAFDLKLSRAVQIPVKNLNSAVAGTHELTNLKVLLAEDNRVNQIVAVRLLEKWKSNVTIANNGKEAVDFVQQNSYDVILMDLDMPVMDGYESTFVIRKNYPHIPVIALTAAAFDDMNNYLSTKGFNEVVQKPFTPDDLYTKIIAVTQRA